MPTRCVRVDHCSQGRKTPGLRKANTAIRSSNDFFVGAEYDGPCPPGERRTTLHLSASSNFAATAETLYQALIKAGEEITFRQAYHLSLLMRHWFKLDKPQRAVGSFRRDVEPDNRTQRGTVHVAAPVEVHTPEARLRLTSD